MTENMQIDLTDPIAVVRSRSLTTLVREAIERHIAEGALAPGEKLTEADWAARLHVSRGPVREAFRSLEELGLVRIEKNRGVFVRTVSLAEADEIYELRAVLEAGACRLACARIDAIGLARLDRCVEAMEAACAASDRDSYARANVEFHDAIVAAAGNAKLYDTYRRLVGELNLFRRAALGAHAGAIEHSLAEHRAMLAALGAQDGERMAQLMHEHVSGGRRRAHEAYARQAGEDMAG
ncbi:phosphonate utilization associated transcriptional regulator [Trinickia fusca]|uniref:Phosphonate utilization associated transcriptional regulator n=1 Tax=Trinickia fusca TaxID=2419777 RepID=A0A494XH43_9BURK|nr:phosphonate utilization associated transcriptional regulator [Trinickia fusca]RKP49112.1 phosphonate utilization associated transcriptional regulator [Trinickia fusca]